MIASIIAATLLAWLPSIAVSQDDKVSAVMAAILQDREAIHVGDTRTRLEERFLPDGGLSTIEERTYVSRRCPYVKVDVVFRRSDNGERGAFVIVSLSRLYVDNPKFD